MSERNAVGWPVNDASFLRELADVCLAQANDDPSDSVAPRLRRIADGLDRRQADEEALPDPAHRCAVCKREWVDSDAGYDTCQRCTSMV